MSVGTADLFTKFEVQHTATEDLYAKFEVRHTATKDLFAEFELQKSEDLKATFDVGQNSEDLKGILQVNQWERLKAVFTVSKANVPYAQLEAEFWVSYNDSGLMSQGIDASVLQALTKIT
jgi:hypothetical protein